MPTRTNQNFYSSNSIDKKDLPIYELEEEKKLISEATDEIKKSLLVKWHKTYLDAQIFPEKLNPLSPAEINSLLSFENSIFYNKLANKFNLNQAQRDSLPQIIWTVCINKNWPELEGAIRTGLNDRQSKELAQEIKQNVLANLAKSQNENLAQVNTRQKEINEVPIERLTIDDAMKRYPEIGEQLISEKHIRLKTFPEPVRPSIKNWISDYIFNVGVNNRSPFVRGEYLFHSQNGRELSPKEREKVALILKSFEEKMPLDINSKLKTVVFTAPVTPKQILPEKKQSPIAPMRPIKQVETPPMHKTIPRQTPPIQKPQGQELPSSIPPAPQAPTPMPIARSFQSDAERLRAWRKDLPLPTQQKTSQVESDWSASNQKNVRFSSPQKLPVENSQSQQNNPFPPEKNPLYDNRPVSQSSGKRLLPKNVVDLRESN